MKYNVFSKILITIAVVSILFQVFTLSVITFLMLAPLGHRSADDLVVIMKETARQWDSLPAEQRAPFVTQQWRKNRIRVSNDLSPLKPSDSLLPYLLFVELSLRGMVSPSTQLLISHDEQGDAWYWADMPVTDGVLRIGFPRDRIGVQPPFALFIVFSVGSLVILLTAVVLARRISLPLEQLSSAARNIGKGDWPEPLPERGPEEMASLTRTFNHMSQQVQQLLANRTTMLAGISHDLRTPLARMQLALAMLPEDTDRELRDGMERDMNEMNSLIAQFLEVSRGLGERHREVVDIREALGDLADDARRSGAEIHREDRGSCLRRLNRMALCRIVSNLLDNAIRYGAQSAVDIDYRCSAQGVTITIADRGPGIPEDKREAIFDPFYRLERSRNTQTGGSGLGLAIARQLAEANGWLIALTAREGGGTEAIVTLPDERGEE